MKGDGKAKC